MGFSAKQIVALGEQPKAACLKTREINGKSLTYLEGWFAIAEANRIFGFDGWHRETLEIRCVLGREARGNFTAIYTAKVRLTVEAKGRKVIREAHGIGECSSVSIAEAHEIALKAAETDATKRTLTTFGNPFGLSLYGSKAVPQPSLDPAAVRPNISTPHAIEHDERLIEHERTSPEPPALAQIERTDSKAAVSIDKSVLVLSEPKRIRDKAHLRYVAVQPCLICGRQPSDAHHLRFSQPRAMGRKVSDEFTVPLCRTHHRLLHQSGNEAAWWEDLQIDALEISKGLWEETRTKR